MMEDFMTKVWLQFNECLSQEQRNVPENGDLPSQRQLQDFVVRTLPLTMSNPEAQESLKTLTGLTDLETFNQISANFIIDSDIDEDEVDEGEEIIIQGFITPSHSAEPFAASEAEAMAVAQDIITLSSDSEDDYCYKPELIVVPEIPSRSETTSNGITIELSSLINDEEISHENAAPNPIILSPVQREETRNGPIEVDHHFDANEIPAESSEVHQQMETENSQTECAAVIEKNDLRNNQSQASSSLPSSSKNKAPKRKSKGSSEERSLESSESEIEKLKAIFQKNNGPKKKKHKSTQKTRKFETESYFGEMESEKYSERSHSSSPKAASKLQKTRRRKLKEDSEDSNDVSEEEEENSENEDSSSLSLMEGKKRRGKSKTKSEDEDPSFDLDDSEDEIKKINLRPKNTPLRSRSRNASKPGSSRDDYKSKNERSSKLGNHDRSSSAGPSKKLSSSSKPSTSFQKHDKIPRELLNLFDTDEFTKAQTKKINHKNNSVEEEQQQQPREKRKINSNKPRRKRELRSTAASNIEKKLRRNEQRPRRSCSIKKQQTSKSKFSSSSSSSEDEILEELIDLIPSKGFRKARANRINNNNNNFDNDGRLISYAESSYHSTSSSEFEKSSSSEESSGGESESEDEDETTIVDDDEIDGEDGEIGTSENEEDGEEESEVEENQTSTIPEKNVFDANQINTETMVAVDPNNVHFGDPAIYGSKLRKMYIKVDKDKCHLFMPEENQNNNEYEIYYCKKCRELGSHVFAVNPKPPTKTGGRMVKMNSVHNKDCYLVRWAYG